jgi:hypothetical protein
MAEKLSYFAHYCQSVESSYNLVVSLNELKVILKQLKCFRFTLKVFNEKAVKALKITEQSGKNVDDLLSTMSEKINIMLFIRKVDLSIVQPDEYKREKLFAAIAKVEFAFI